MLTKIGFIVCGVALCGTTYTLVQQQRQIQALTLLVGEPARAAEGGAPAAARPAALVTRIAQLETRVGDLGQVTRSERRVRSSERPEPRPAPSAEGPPRAAAAPNTEGAVLDLLESDDPQIRERFRAVVQEEQERLSDERREQRLARFAERSRERVSDLATRVHLSDQQVDWLNDALDAEREQVSALFNRAREDQDFAETRSKVRQIRDTTDSHVKAELKDDQFSAYAEMREDERRRFGPPQDRPGPEPAGGQGSNARQN